MEKLLDKFVEFVKAYYQEGLFLIFTNVLTYFFAVRNARKNISLEHQKELGAKIATALTKARSIVAETHEIDVFKKKTVKSLLMTADVFKSTAYYPAFMQNKKTLLTFVEGLSACRAECEPYLDLQSAGYLYVLEKYFLNMAFFIRKYKIEDIDILGCLALCDIQKWSRAFDKLLVRQLNKTHHRLYSMQGKR